MNTNDINLIKEMEGCIQQPIKTIYIVKYNEIHYMAESKISRNNTYNLFTFENIDDAKDYMNLSYKLIVTPNVTKGDYRIMFETDADETTLNENNIIWRKCTKLIGYDKHHASQTKFFTFTIEKINLKLKNPNGK